VWILWTCVLWYFVYIFNSSIFWDIRQWIKSKNTIHSAVFQVWQMTIFQPTQQRVTHHGQSRIDSHGEGGCSREVHPKIKVLWLEILLEAGNLFTLNDTPLPSPMPLPIMVPLIKLQFKWSNIHNFFLYNFYFTPSLSFLCKQSYSTPLLIL
jgi:hypothetical protein